MIEIVMPSEIDGDYCYGTMAAINQDALIRIERRDKGQQTDHYIAAWDDGVAPEPTNQEILDAYLIAYAAEAYKLVDAEEASRIAAAEMNPAIGITLDEKKKDKANKRRDNKAKRKVNPISDADDHLYDHIDLIYDASEQIRDDIEAAADTAAIDLIITAMPTDVRWPTWSPI